MNRSRSFSYHDEHVADFILDTGSTGHFFSTFRLVKGSCRCGSGRDSLAFRRLGYDVVPMDASSAIVEAASRLTGVPALLLRFDRIDWGRRSSTASGHAALLHVASCGTAADHGQARNGPPA